MYAILVMGLIVSLVAGDIGIGYNYKVPETLYGVPAYQPSTGTYNTGYNGNSAWQNKGQGSQGNNYNTQNSAYQGFQSANNFGNYNSGADYQHANGGQYFLGSGVTYQGGYVQPSYQSSSSNAQAGYQGFNHNYQTSSQYQTSAVEKYQQYYNQLQQQPPQVFKHFYVHAAPEEPEPKRSNPIILPPPQKHYKIIFIKAPSQPVAAPQYIPVPQQNEEKTIVYVLVKKPEEQPEIQLPKIEQKPPAKPEVFFIKYNNKDDKSVINNIVNDYNTVDSVNLGTDGTGPYIGSQPVALGQFAQSSANSGSYNQASGSSYTPASGQYYPLPSSVGSESTQGIQSSGLVSQTESQSFIGTIGSQANEGVQSFSEVTSDGSSSEGASTASSHFNLENLVSTNQQVPHETYGLPKFRN